MAPITLISEPPIFMALESFDEFQASTPASGSFDHEPVLHHLEKAATVTVEPAISDFDHAKNSIGDIYITEAALTFYNPETKSGFSVPYPTVTLHATSKQSPPQQSGSERELQQCIYCQLDETEPEDWDNLAEEDMPETREMYIFTSDPAAVQAIYSALSRCASLHPSIDTNEGPAIDFEGLMASAQSGEIPEDDTAIISQNGHAEPIEQADGAEDMTPGGRAQLERLENLIDWQSVDTSSHQMTVSVSEQAVADAPNDNSA